MNKFMPILSIFSFFSLFTYAVAAIYKPALVLESFEGWPFSDYWRNAKVRWPQRIWGLCAFLGFIVMVVFVVHGMWSWLPDSSDVTDEDGNSSDGKWVWIVLLSLVGSIGGMKILVGFAKLRFENESLKYLAFQLKEIMSGATWERQRIVQDIKKSFTEKRHGFSDIFGIYDHHYAKEEILHAAAELTENIKSETDQTAVKRINENCEKETCSLWIKRKEKARVDYIENQRFMEQLEIEIEGDYPENSHEYLTEQWVKEILFENLGVNASEIKNKALLKDDLGIEDDEIEDLIKTIEKQFVLSIPSKEVMKFRTLGDIVKYLQINGEKIDLSEKRSMEIAMESVLLKEKMNRGKKENLSNNNLPKVDENPDEKDFIN